MTLENFIQTAKERLDACFKTYLVDQTYPAAQLQEAMRYSIMNGGKRIRPLLVYLTGRTLGAAWEDLDAAACAVEFIHVYSLIHDDLPAMDNSDLRRGKPTCHKAFNEALAILAGDTLQCFAFEILANHSCNLSATQRLQMIKSLAEASGNNGMAAGQTLDLAGTTTLHELTHMYQLKTGALLSASVELGAIAANANSVSLKKFARDIGLAFQIQDDLLDIEGTQTGKPQGIDIANHKVTYPSLLGMEKCRMEVSTLFHTALDSLQEFGAHAGLLRDFANMLMQRKT